jgi:hypothetical protein
MAEGEEVVLVQVNATDGSSLRHVRELIFEYTQAKSFSPRFRTRAVSPHPLTDNHATPPGSLLPFPSLPISADQTRM